jgi:HSP20 family molecular chaperone IbpA
MSTLRYEVPNFGLRIGSDRGNRDGRQERARTMSRQNGLSSPFLLGFDEFERAVERVTKATGDGYPPYNIERILPEGGEPERLRITLAVAGFVRKDIEILVEDRQLLVKGRQTEDKTRQFLHRGIAARQFQRVFLLADSIEVLGADLAHGLLSIDLVRPLPERVSRRIAIDERE